MWRLRSLFGTTFAVKAATAQWQEESQRLAALARELRLPLPPLLIELRDAGRWRQPTDEAIQNAIPFLQGCVNLVRFTEEWGYPQIHLADQPVWQAQFHEYRGSRDEPRDLPWIDAELSVFIASSAIPGEDIGIALDYRTSRENPRVVASYWPEKEAKCYWHLVDERFSDFVEKLGL